MDRPSWLWRGGAFLFTGIAFGLLTAALIAVGSAAVAGAAAGAAIANFILALAAWLLSRHDARRLP